MERCSFKFAKFAPAAFSCSLMFAMSKIMRRGLSPPTTSCGTPHCSCDTPPQGGVPHEVPRTPQAARNSRRPGHDGFSARPPPVTEQDSDSALRGTVVRPRWPSGQTGWRPPEFEESNFIRHFSASTTAGWLVRSCRALGAALAGWLNAGWLNHDMPGSAAKLKMHDCVSGRWWTSHRLEIFLRGDKALRLGKAARLSWRHGSASLTCRSSSLFSHDYLGTIPAQLVRDEPINHAFQTWQCAWGHTKTTARKSKSIF